MYVVTYNRSVCSRNFACILSLNGLLVIDGMVFCCLLNIQLLSKGRGVKKGKEKKGWRRVIEKMWIGKCVINIFAHDYLHKITPSFSGDRV